MSEGHLQNLITGGGKHPWIDGAPPRTFAAWLTSATADILLSDASFLVPRLTLGGLAILVHKIKRQFHGLTVGLGLFVVSQICFQVKHALVVYVAYGFVAL